MKLLKIKNEILHTSSDTNVATVRKFKVISDKLKADITCTVPKHDDDDDDDDDNDSVMCYYYYYY